MATRSIDCATFPTMRVSRPDTSCTASNRGREPSDWKPMPTIGAGVREIRIREVTGAYRVIYIATLPDAIHVLHAFQKKTQKTARRDLDLAIERLQRLKKGN